MRRWLPQSLVGRLMGVLFAGLLLALWVSTVINLDERDQLLFSRNGMQSAQRIAETVELLDALDIKEQQRIIALLNVPPFMVRLDADPLPMEAAAMPGPQATEFRAALHNALGQDRPVRVAQSATPMPPEARGPGSGYGRRRAMQEGKPFVPGMYRWTHADARAGVSFGVQIRLHSGQWVTFGTHVPRTQASMPLRWVASLAVLAVAVLLLSFWAVHWITRPLHVLARAADALGQDIHHPPLPEIGSAEVRQAAHAFNTMQARLLRLIQDRTRMLVAISHDLKTPITRLRLRADLLDDEELRQRFEQDLKEMESMVNQTLDFMRGVDQTQPRQAIHLMALLQSLQADYADMGHTVSITGEVAQPFVGALLPLKRCLTNLLDNAIAYGQQADIAVQDSATEVILRIRDHGEGIPQNEQARVFEPFYRLEHSRNRTTGGTGVGLAIVRSIVEMHGGTVNLKNHPEGGLEVTLYLPRVASGHQGQRGPSPSPVPGGVQPRAG